LQVVAEEQVTIIQVIKQVTVVVLQVVTQTVHQTQMAERKMAEAVAVTQAVVLEVKVVHSIKVEMPVVPVVAQTPEAAVEEAGMVAVPAVQVLQVVQELLLAVVQDIYIHQEYLQVQR
jgi:hypothetical protein